MNAELLSKNLTTNYTFRINIDEATYDVTVYLNEKGKFIDDSITQANGELLGYEGEEGDIREQIIDYLDNNWDLLVGE
jgi:hypothetical protein